MLFVLYLHISYLICIYLFYSRGAFQNLLDFCEWQCCGLFKIDTRDWKQVYYSEDEEESSVLLRSEHHYI